MLGRRCALQISICQAIVSVNSSSAASSRTMEPRTSEGTCFCTRKGSLQLPTWAICLCRGAPCVVLGRYLSALCAGLTSRYGSTRTLVQCLLVSAHADKDPPHGPSLSHPHSLFSFLLGSHPRAGSLLRYIAITPGSGGFPSLRAVRPRRLLETPILSISRLERTGPPPRPMTRPLRLQDPHLFSYRRL